MKITILEPAMCCNTGVKLEDGGKTPVQITTNAIALEAKEQDTIRFQIGKLVVAVKESESTPASCCSGTGCC